MESILNELEGIGIVPVIKIEDASLAVPLARSLAAGGIPCAEVTFRTAAAEESIRRIAAEVPSVLLGAGTVINESLARKAIAAGARFVVAPGFNPAVVDACLEAGVPVFPGVNNPSGVEAALEKGLSCLKFFPAEASGGVAMLDALAGPFPSVSFLPTGGIGPDNLADYARRQNVLAVGGTWMVKPDAVEAGRWDEISALCREARRAMQGFRVAHVGINSPDEGAATDAAALFSIFSSPAKPGASSIFCGQAIEVMKSPFRGTHGHLAVECLNVERALAYLAPLGFKPVPETAKTGKGRITVVYLDREIAGFAVHLVRAG